MSNGFNGQKLESHTYKEYYWRNLSRVDDRLAYELVSKLLLSSMDSIGLFEYLCICRWYPLCQDCHQNHSLDTLPDPEAHTPLKFLLPLEMLERSI